MAVTDAGKATCLAYERVSTAPEAHQKREERPARERAPKRRGAASKRNAASSKLSYGISGPQRVSGQLTLQPWPTLTSDTDTHNQAQAQA